MVQIKTSANINDIKGSIGENIFSSNRGKLYIRSKGKTHSNPQSANQASHRNWISEFSKRWNDTLTIAQRNAWEQYANGLKEKMSGFNALLKANITRKDFGVTIPSIPNSLAFNTDAGETNEYARSMSNLGITGKTNRTICGWVYPTSANTGDYAYLIFSCGTNLVWEFTGLYLRGRDPIGIRKWGVGIGGVTWVPTDYIPNAWQWFCFTFTDNGNGTISYRFRLNNGAPFIYTSAAFVGSGDAKIYFGGGQGAYRFFGKIQDFRIIKRVITDAERAAIYNAGAGTFNALGDEYDWYKFTELTGNKAYDSGSSINNLDLINMENADWQPGKIILQVPATFMADPPIGITPPDTPRDITATWNAVTKKIDLTWNPGTVPGSRIGIWIHSHDDMIHKQLTATEDITVLSKSISHVKSKGGVTLPLSSFRGSVDIQAQTCDTYGQLSPLTKKLTSIQVT